MIVLLFVLKQVLGELICAWVRATVGLRKYKSCEKSPGFELVVRIQ
jgi:hypothetical protein